MTEVILRNVRQDDPLQEDAIRDWLSEHVGEFGISYWTVVSAPQNPTRDKYGFRSFSAEADLCVTFADPRSALLFKLTWGGK